MMADLIDRDAVIAIIEDKQKALCPVGMFSRHAVYGDDRRAFDDWDEIIEAVSHIPTVDAVATGRAEWDILVSKNINDYWQADMACPLCGFIKMNIWSGFFPNIDAETARRVTMEYAKRCKKPNFCEKCGADMREVEKDD